MSETISTHFYDLPTTHIRRNRHIYPSGSAGSLRIVNFVDLFSQVGILSHGPFIYPPRHPKLDAEGENELVEPPRVPFTVYVVADLDSEAGLALVKEALDSMVRVLRLYIDYILLV
jgi:UDP-glucose:glycoprotein glucosyltransferase